MSTATGRPRPGPGNTESWALAQERECVPRRVRPTHAERWGAAVTDTRAKR